MIANSEMIYTYIKNIEDENLKLKNTNEELLTKNQTLIDENLKLKNSNDDVSTKNQRLIDENLKFKNTNDELLIKNQTLTDDLTNLNKFSIFNNLNKQLKDKTNQVLSLEKTISKLHNTHTLPVLQTQEPVQEQLEELVQEQLEELIQEPILVPEPKKIKKNKELELVEKPEQVQELELVEKPEQEPELVENQKRLKKIKNQN